MRIRYKHFCHLNQQESEEENKKKITNWYIYMIDGIQMNRLSFHCISAVWYSQQAYPPFYNIPLTISYVSTLHTLQTYPQSI